MTLKLHIKLSMQWFESYKLIEFHASRILFQSSSFLSIIRKVPGRLKFGWEDCEVVRNNRGDFEISTVFDGQNAKILQKKSRVT